MKRRWHITIGFLSLAALGALLLSGRGATEQKALEETRREMRKQGFKTDLAEFDFSTSDEFRVRVTALTNAATYTVPRNQADAARRSLLQQDMPELMQTIGSDSAIPVWKQETWAAEEGTATYLRSAGLSNDLWPVLRETFNNDRAVLDEACAAALSGPIRFHLDASHGSAMLLPHLAGLKNLNQTLGGRTVLKLHERDRDGAWTNVLAATRLVTAWEPEPSEVSHLVRDACANLVFNLTWQALQTDGWTEEQLTRLQREWESVDFFKSLPETAAFARACGVESFQRERQQITADFGLILRECFRSPQQAWPSLRSWYQRLRYWRQGSYEDEQKLLLHYRDLELQLRKAMQAQTWLEMRQIPGSTNTTPLQSKGFSTTSAMLNVKQLSLSAMMYSSGGQVRTLPGCAAVAEARRRLVITAIALERFHGRHGVYPKSLNQLSPEWLKNPPVDFMDGHSLRYRPTDDGHFVLYSVGLDCIDGGGVQPSRRKQLPMSGPNGFSTKRETDLVWPRPASAAEVESFHGEQIRALAEQTRRGEEAQAEDQWSRTAERQARVGKLLAAEPVGHSTNPTHRGRPIAEVLANKNTVGTNTLSLGELLTLKQVRTGEEPEIATFDVPVAYDTVTNLGALALLIDPVPDKDSDEDCQAGWLECRRATNGNCLMVWNTIYESPGPHALQLGLSWNEPAKADENFFVGPMAGFVVSNLCQFSLASAYFKPELGATLRAKLPEPNATYFLEITSPNGELLKNFTGSASNGLMTVHWDLVDNHGRRRTNISFNTVIHLKLQDSGRSQTLKGP